MQHFFTKTAFTIMLCFFLFSFHASASFETLKKTLLQTIDSFTSEQILHIQLQNTNIDHIFGLEIQTKSKPLMNESTITLKGSRNIIGFLEDFSTTKNNKTTVTSLSDLVTVHFIFDQSSLELSYKMHFHNEVYRLINEIEKRLPDSENHTSMLKEVFDLIHDQWFFINLEQLAEAIELPEEATEQINTSFSLSEEEMREYMKRNYAILLEFVEKSEIFDVHTSHNALHIELKPSLTLKNVENILRATFVLLYDIYELQKDSCESCENLELFENIETFPRNENIQKQNAFIQKIMNDSGVSYQSIIDNYEELQNELNLKIENTVNIQNNNEIQGDASLSFKTPAGTIIIESTTKMKHDPFLSFTKMPNDRSSFNLLPFIRFHAEKIRMEHFYGNESYYDYDGFNDEYNYDYNNTYFEDYYTPNYSYDSILMEIQNDKQWYTPHAEYLAEKWILKDSYTPQKELTFGDLQTMMRNAGMYIEDTYHSSSSITKRQVLEILLGSYLGISEQEAEVFAKNNGIISKNTNVDTTLNHAELYKIYASILQKY